MYAYVFLFYFNTVGLSARDKVLGLQNISVKIIVYEPPALSLLVPYKL